MKYAATRDDPIPAPVIARAIVSACRAVGADPIAVGSGELDRVAGVANRERVVARARYYAGFALRCLYPDRNRTLLAAYVGVKHRGSAGSFFSALDQRLASGLSWWRQGVVDQVVSDATEAVVVKPLKIGDLPTKGTTTKAPPPMPVGTLERGGFRPAPGTYERELADTPAPRTGLDRFAARYGSTDQLTTRALERRECRDLLAEAAANTAKLQAKLPKE